jgi:hypothetical protein
VEKIHIFVGFFLIEELIYTLFSHSTLFSCIFGSCSVVYSGILCMHLYTFSAMSVCVCVSCVHEFI